MKKFIAPIILFVGVFLATLLLQKHTFECQEFDGLFLLSGDYFAGMFHKPFPISGIIADFLTQFFRFGVYAPVIVGLGVVLAFFLVRSILARFCIGWDVLSAIFAGALWVFIAFAPSAKRGVAAVLILFLVWLVSRLLPKRKPLLLKNWVEIAGTALVTGGVFLFLFLNADIRQKEKSSALKSAVAIADWNRVLTVATPEACFQDRSMTPFALLAIGEKGQLGNYLFNFPVYTRADLDMTGVEESTLSYFYKAVLYENLRCPNEAIHNLFQLATLQEHGQSFMILRHLIADNFLLGNYDMVEKYCEILSKSTLHGQYVRYFKEQMAAGTAHTPDSADVRKLIPLISHDALYNLLLFQASGLEAPSTVDRILCTLLVDKDLERFRSVFATVKDRYTAIPRYYEEALIFADGATEDISPETLRRYTDFQASMLSMGSAAKQRAFADTYWFYYLSKPEVATD